MCTIFQVFLAKHKQEDKVYAVKVLTKAAIRKRNEVCQIVSLLNFFAAVLTCGNIGFGLR